MQERPVLSLADAAPTEDLRDAFAMRQALPSLRQRPRRRRVRRALDVPGPMQAGAPGQYEPEGRRRVFLFRSTSRTCFAPSNRPFSSVRLRQGRANKAHFGQVGDLGSKRGVALARGLRVATLEVPPEVG